MCEREYLSDNKTKENVEVTVECIFCYRVLRGVFRTQLATKTEHFLGIVNCFEPLTIFPGNSILIV